MAVLRELQTGRVVTLHAEHLVGRSRRCDLRLEAPAISSQHATLRWTGTRWVLRDLGSRNGTLLDGGLLPAGEHPVEAGMTLHFGTEACGWALDNDAPPQPAAVPVDDAAAVVSGAEGLLNLPGGEAPPQVSVYRNAEERWMAEWVDGREQTVEDLEQLQIAGRSWRLHLPDQSRSTEAAGPVAPTLGSVRFVFDVSRDQEDVRLTLEHGPERWDLGARAHHWTLLLLAKTRDEDMYEDPSERGWIYGEDLARQVRLTEGTLSVYIFRARQQIAACGIEGAHGLVERRKPTRQLRFGGHKVLIRQH